MADELARDFGVDPELIEGSRGAFEVLVNDEVIFSTLKLGRFPNDGEITWLIESLNLFEEGKMIEEEPDLYTDEDGKPVLSFKDFTFWIYDDETLGDIFILESVDECDCTDYDELEKLIIDIDKNSGEFSRLDEQSYIFEGDTEEGKRVLLDLGMKEKKE